MTYACSKSLSVNGWIIKNWWYWHNNRRYWKLKNY